MADQELFMAGLASRARAAWGKHATTRFLFGGTDMAEREFIAGYCAREAEMTRDGDMVWALARELACNPPTEIAADLGMRLGELILGVGDVDAVVMCGVPGCPAPGDHMAGVPDGCLAGEAPAGPPLPPVVRALADWPGVSAAVLAGHLGKRTGDVYSDLVKAEGKGLVSRSRDGHKGPFLWEVTP